MKNATFSRKRLFYDIETSYTKGLFFFFFYNQTILPHQILEYPRIICISWKWEGRNEQVQNVEWGLKKQCDKKLLTKFIKELDKADEIVAHNGDRFDIKWIRARAMKHDIPMRHDYNMIDTLKICRSLLNLPSNKLAEVAKYYDLEAKGDPGGIRTWIDIIENKDQEALTRMIEYCDKDVIVLEAVYNKLKPYCKAKFNYSVLTGGTKYQCPECANPSPKLSKTSTTVMGSIKRHMKCNNCEKNYTISNKSYMDYLEDKIKVLES